MRLVVGRVVRPHGIRGEVVVDPATDRPAERFRPGAVLTTRTGALTVRAARPHSGRWLLSVDGVVDRSAADALRGAELMVEVADDEPAAEPDAWYDAQLVGLAVRERSGVIGSVAAVEHGPGQDLLVLDLAGSGRVRLPFVAALVPEVDVAGGWIRVALPPGLLDLAER